MIDTSDPSNPLPPLFIGMGNCRISSTAKQCTISQLEPLVPVAALVVVAQVAHRHSWAAPRSACSTVAAGWTCIACWGCPTGTRSSTWATRCSRIYSGKEGTNDCLLRMLRILALVMYVLCVMRLFLIHYVGRSVHWDGGRVWSSPSSQRSCASHSSKCP